MRVALYHPWIYLKSGLERTLLEITRLSKHEWTLYTSHFDRDGTYPELNSCKVVEVGQVSVRRAYAPVLQAAATIASLRIDPADYDVLVISCDGLGSLLTVRNRARPVVCLCFTPLRAVYDEAYRARHLARLGWKRPIGLVFEAGWRAIDRLCWRRYDAIVAISEEVKRRIVRGGLASADAVSVIRPGIPRAWITGGDAPDRYFFLPGRIMWTKNIELGIRAFALARPRLPAGYRLVVAGMVDAKSTAYFSTLRGLAEELEVDVEFRVGPTDDEMRFLYRRCRALLFTAFNEDWGLTPIEAMAVGRPVIAVDRGGPREIVRHGVSGFLEPDEPGRFAERMIELANDDALWQRMSAGALADAGRFTWEGFVEELDAVIDRSATPSLATAMPSPSAA